MSDSSTHIDEALSELDTLATLTDEQLLQKYAPCFQFEKDFREAIDSGRINLSKKVLAEDSEDDETTEGELSVEEATKRILEKKAKKSLVKKEKKKSEEEKLRQMLLDDDAMIKEMEKNL